MTRRPVLKCKSNRVLCPDPTCRRLQFNANSRVPGKWRGRGVASCECGQEFFHHTADGGTEVVGLWPGEADQLDIDEPLPAIWERLGLMERVA